MSAAGRVAAAVAPALRVLGACLLQPPSAPHTGNTPWLSLLLHHRNHGNCGNHGNLLLLALLLMSGHMMPQEMMEPNIIE